MDMRVTDPSLNLIAQLGQTGGAMRTPLYSDFRNNPGVGTNNWVELDRMEDDGLLFFNHRTISGKSASVGRIRTNYPTRHRNARHNGAGGAQDCRLHTGHRRCRGQDHDRKRADIVRHGGVE
ncbi:hypothetical protein ACFIOY_22020 [Bradyrhizobium sp. TZ2]